MRRVLAIVVGLGLVAGGGWLGFMLAMQLVVGLTLKEQPGLVQMPVESRASAVGNNPIRIKLNGTIAAQVPFKQTLQLPLHGRYDADVSFDTVVPIAFTIDYRGAIAVDTLATIRGVTDFNYQNVKRLRNVEFTAQIPLQFEQPVVLKVPVKADLRIVYHGPLTVNFDQTVSAPVDTTLHTRLHAVREIETPLLTRFDFDVRWPKTPVPVVITHADLRLPLDTLRLTRKPDAGADAAASIHKD